MIPQLAPGCRIRRVSAEETVMLIPEGVLQLDEACAEILDLVDGTRTVAEIVAELQGRYGEDAAEAIAVDVQAFFERLQGRGVVLFSKPS